MAPRALVVSVDWPHGVRMHEVAPEPCQFLEALKNPGEHRDFTLVGTGSRNGALASRSIGATGNAKEMTLEIGSGRKDRPKPDCKRTDPPSASGETPV